MSGKHERSTPADVTRIHVNEVWELQYWSEEIGVSREAIVAAVEAVGTMVRDVREHLGKQR